MHRTPPNDPPADSDAQRAALARAERLTSELIELVGAVRAGLAKPEDPVAPEGDHARGRLKSGDLRAAMSHASRRSTRQVPHLLG
jgi:hypothetical protein